MALHNHTRLFIFIFLLALFVRIALIGLRGEWRVPDRVGGEAGVMATHLLDGRGFASPFDGGQSPSTHLPPLYPLLLAGILQCERMLTHAGTGTGPDALTFYIAAAINLLASCITPWIGMKIAQAAGINRNTSILAAILICFIPEAARASTLVWDEALLCLSIALLLWWMISILSQRVLRLTDTILIGIAGGILSLLNPAYIPALIVTWILGVLFKDGIKGRWWLHGIVLTGSILLAGLPWHIRNWIMLDPPARVFVRGNFWLEIRTSFEPLTIDASGKRLPSHPWAGTDPLVHDGRRLTEQDYFAWTRERIHAAIKAEPGKYTRHVIRETAGFWSGISEAQRWGRNSLFFFIAQGIPALAGIAGLIIGRKQLKPEAQLVFWTALLIFPIPYYLAGAGARYRHPLDLVLYIGIALFIYFLSSIKQTCQKT